MYEKGEENMKRSEYLKTSVEKTWVHNNIVKKKINKKKIVGNLNLPFGLCLGSGYAPQLTMFANHAICRDSLITLYLVIN